MIEQRAEQRVDILANILNDTSDGKIKGLDELDKLIHVMSDVENPLADMTAGATPKKKKRSPRKAAKRKTTHYLTEDVFDGIGEAKESLQKLLPNGDKMRATKSAIVESAVKVLLDEFERKGKKSYLVKELLKDHK